jgi:hypothetical protein
MLASLQAVSGVSGLLAEARVGLTRALDQADQVGDADDMRCGTHMHLYTAVACVVSQADAAYTAALHSSQPRPALRSGVVLHPCTKRAALPAPQSLPLKCWPPAGRDPHCLQLTLTGAIRQDQFCQLVG